jgi:tetratricopeptide (TPR) repeat protein
VDIQNMSPREAADRLFNRVMTAASSGNVAEMTQFLPMAIQSYDMARPLDQDGFFHLSLLHQQGEDWAAALAAAEEGLATYPNHLLNLSAAGNSAAGLGDQEQARSFFQRFLDAYEEESVLELPEYQAHQNMFADMKVAAEEYVGG